MQMKDTRFEQMQADFADGRLTGDQAVSSSTTSEGISEIERDGDGWIIYKTEVTLAGRSL